MEIIHLYVRDLVSENNLTLNDDTTVPYVQILWCNIAFHVRVGHLYMINSFLSTGCAKKGPVGKSGFFFCFSFFIH